jgi:hypothetical protein
VAYKDREKMLEQMEKARSMNPAIIRCRGRPKKPKSLWDGPGKRPPGRPRKPRPEPTEEEIEADIMTKLKVEHKDVCELAQLQIGDEEISIFIQQPLDYVKDLYRVVIDRNKLIGKIRLLQAQYKKAHEGNSNMLMWLGKHCLGQKDGITASSFEPEFRTLTRALERLEDGTSQLLIDTTKDAIITTATTHK